MKLIGLYSPFPQMGKNTFAEELERLALGRTVTLSFADAMRKVVVDFVADFMDGGEAEALEWLGDSRKDTKLIPVIGVTFRHLLQTIGTEWGRRLIHPDLWTLKAQSMLRKRSAAPLIVFDDLRFENEHAMLRKEGAVLVRITREAQFVPRTKKHESNARLEGLEFDYHVTNDGDVEELQAKALLIAQAEGIV